MIQIKVLQQFELEFYDIYILVGSKKVTGICEYAKLFGLFSSFENFFDFNFQFEYSGVEFIYRFIKIIE